MESFIEIPEEIKKVMRDCKFSLSCEKISQALISLA